MEIKNSLNQLNPHLNKLDADKITKDGKIKASDTAVSKGGDVIDLSSAKLKGVIMQAVQEAPEIRQDKINELKALVESGEYTVDTNDIAVRLLQSDAEVF